MPQVSPNPELIVEERLPAKPAAIPSITEVLEAVVRDSVEAPEYLAQTEVPHGGE